MSFRYPKIWELGAALVPVYWTFTGWNAPLSMGSEIKDPHIILPKVMVLGPLLVMILYMLFALVTICVIPYNILQITAEPKHP